MRTSAIARQRTPASVRTGTSASLSVVVVSAGSAADVQKAATALRGASHEFQAQLIFVARAADPGFVDMVERQGGEFIQAPKGSSRAEMCDLGMSRAHGSIVAVRDDVAVGDARWLDAYRGVVPQHEPVRPATTESIVMDSLVARRVQLADVTTPRPASDSHSRNAESEMATAV
jgi:hypothetical protein